ncbi:helix-turn-helix transcriptional regulator [Streptomyces salyersiae]|uniref:Helix-turn-helix transcriptional regulator n=1 Tax=Streptomyces salyersiae TaxID=3075530 RepID=A0ABU2RSF4_9ACTN|nr:helix-turn-helix transcriptional regulator [Streptomyces sp. DSM 41770]MDT0431238.1 helix-turn-helix transcriptional regulator [Streptomyces sp. DSM 41770]
MGSTDARYGERASRLGGAVVWTWTGPRGPARPVLPDGCMDLLLWGGTLVVAGPDTHAFTPQGADGTGDASCAGIRFAPGTAPALLGVPARELRDRRVPLDALWPGARVRRLTERIDAAADPVAALEEAALRRAAGAQAPDPLTAAVAAGLRQGRSVGEVAREVGLGARQLHRRSLAAFGYGPKTLARILRLQRALALVRAGTAYADAAYAVGCADQAHLAREVRELTGTTLGGYLAGIGHGAEDARSGTAQPSGDGG